MNHITVMAYGSPGSFARRVQENPSLAVAIMQAAENLLKELEAVEDRPELDTELPLAEAIAEARGDGTPSIPAEHVCLFKEGDQWAAVRPDFVNLQVSPSGIAETADEAVSALLLAELGDSMAKPGGAA